MPSRTSDDILKDFMKRGRGAQKEVDKTIKKEADPAPKVEKEPPEIQQQFQVRIGEAFNQIHFQLSQKVQSFNIPPAATVQMAKQMMVIAKKIMTVPPNIKPN